MVLIWVTMLLGLLWPYIRCPLQSLLVYVGLYAHERLGGDVIGGRVRPQVGVASLRHHGQRWMINSRCAGSFPSLRSGVGLAATQLPQTSVFVAFQWQSRRQRRILRTIMPPKQHLPCWYCPTHTRTHKHTHVYTDTRTNERTNTCACLESVWFTSVNSLVKCCSQCCCRDNRRQFYCWNPSPPTGTPAASVNINFNPFFTVRHLKFEYTLLLWGLVDPSCKTHKVWQSAFFTFMVY